jgi:hypothetical protein
MINPYTQGDLDGLCGAYAAINAVKIISKKFCVEEWQNVFLKILKQQIKHRKSVFFMVHGLNESKISKILQRIIRQRFEITYSRPFKRRKKVRLDEYWDCLHDFLNGGDRRSAIIGYENKGHSHWTVVAFISPNQLYLFDSGGRKSINRRRCTTTEITPETPILLDFTATFLLEAK